MKSCPDSIRRVSHEILDPDLVVDSRWNVEA
jgi:hypothetical protein